MGRTVPTFNMSLEREITQWKHYRRALRREDQEAFDALFTHARQHMVEAAAAARPIPFDAIVMSILLEQQKQIEELRVALAHERGEDPYPASTQAPRELKSDSIQKDFLE